MLTTGAFVVLMSMVLATDAISVTNIFSQFKLPHSLKIQTEGESLANDATAVIAFYFIGLPLLKDGDISIANVGIDILRVFIFSILIGLIVGIFFFFMMFLFHKSIEELFLILMTAYSAYAVAESFHLSGILSLIVGVIFLKNMIVRHMENFEANQSGLVRYEGILELIRSRHSYKKEQEAKKRILSATTYEKLKYNEDIIDSFSIIATAFLFFSLAELININSLIHYWKEILIVFIATTIIRALVMLKFAYITNKTNRMHNVSIRWWGVLTFSGVKGGLSLIMVHNLPKNFQYKEMFETIVIGVIILSIFIYSFSLLFLISKYKQEFLKEYNEENEIDNT
jgi:monovalent cation:H+ antiporter, CPA1 family